MNSKRALNQGYVICSSEERLLMLFNFLKRNRNKKILVVYNSHLSVEFHHELFNYKGLTVSSIHVSI